MRLATKSTQLSLWPNIDGVPASNPMFFFWFFFSILATLIGVCDAEVDRASSASSVQPVALTVAAQEKAENKDDQANALGPASRSGTTVRIQLPIDSNVSARVRKTLQEQAERAPAATPASGKPVVVLEFEAATQTGRGSELEACIALARYLGSPELHRIHTVAYLPSKNTNPPTQLNGHAVLVAVAANQLALEPGTAIGAAGIDDKTIEPWVREVYRSIAQQRLTEVPEEVVLSMLDAREGLHRVTKSDGGVVYVNSQQRDKLETEGASNSDQIAANGELAVLTREQLEEFGLVRLTPETRADLARQLDLVPSSLESKVASGKDRIAIQINLPSYIDEKSAQWLTLEMSRQVSRQKANLIILNIDSNQGEVDACLRIAQRLVEFDQNKVRTVAYVRESAIGPVGLVALSCSHLIMAPDSQLGGRRSPDDEVDFDDEELSKDDLRKLKPLVQAVAKKKQSDWSLMMSMLDPKLTLTRYRQKDKQAELIRILSNEEFESLEDRETWAPLRPLGGENGINAVEAERASIARTVAEDMGQIQTMYQLENSPKVVQPTATDRWVERLARFLSSPFVAPWLLFGAMFFFSTEMSAPGLGLPGFLATLCFVAFFWSQYLGGNADWLEIIMFTVGVIFVLIEIFALPGFGVFGIGGLLMIIVSVVLASQSFLIPRTTQELAQIPFSLLPVLGAGFGVIAGAFAIRKILPNSPYLRRMMLEPRKRIDTGLESQTDPEAVVDWSHLAGETGTTVTKLYPAGKARIAGRVYDVVSNGSLVDKGEEVVVVEAQGNRIVVKPVSPKSENT